MSLFTFRRATPDRTLYLSRYGRDGDPLAETADLNAARLFRDLPEFQAWLAGLETHEREAFARRRWTRAELMLTEMSPGLAKMRGVE